MKTDKYFRSVTGILPRLAPRDTGRPFAEVPIDSMDLAAIRVALERTAGLSITDAEWVSCETLDDLFGYCAAREGMTDVSAGERSASRRLSDLTLEMPQMAVEALSENWLFKELGGLHWHMLCEGLSTPSFDLKDDLGNRLYATFVRIRLESSLPLCEFKENERVGIDGTIARFGGSMYFSDFEVGGQTGRIKAKLMTTFSAREGNDNTRLTKTQPGSGIRNTTRELPDYPDFGNEYRLMRKGEIDRHRLGGALLSTGAEVVHETVYELNPYYDLNGVGLLYFAAYPIITDVCEARFFNKETAGLRWEESYYTVARDVFYLGNCNSSDRIIHRLHEVQRPSDGIVATQSTLSRGSDRSPIARVFTVKQARGGDSRSHDRPAA
jgi:probable biosynthetic protein (TIGR04098 family)